MIETKEIIDKLKALGATVSELDKGDGTLIYSIDISSIPNEQAKLTVAQLLDSITTVEGNGTSNTSN